VVYSKKKMSNRLNNENFEQHSQEKAKLSLHDIEVNSIDPLIAQPSPAFKETLKKLLAANNEEIVSYCEKIARSAKLNKKILECLDRIDQQDLERTNIASRAGVVQQNTAKVSIYDFWF
jgi:hypothetical protein